jgi:hypothetical protein
MNTLSGYTEIELAGEVIPFKFGTNAWSLFCEKKNIEFYEIFKSGIFGKFGDFGVNEKGEPITYKPEPDIFALQELFYFAYVTAKRMKKETAFTYEEFTAMMDETPGAMVALQKVLLESKVMGYTFTQLAEGGEKANFPNP